MAQGPDDLVKGIVIVVLVVLFLLGFMAPVVSWPLLVVILYLLWHHGRKA